MFTRSTGKRRKRSTQVRARKLPKIKNRNFESSGSWLPVDNWREQTSHTLSVPHKMISESPACLNCPNGVRGSFAGPLVKSTYVKLTGNALLADVAHRKRGFVTLPRVADTPSNWITSEGPTIPQLCSFSR